MPAWVSSALLDGGRTWSQFVSSSAAGIPRRIGVIAIDPFDSKHLILGGVTHDPGDASAVLFDG
jgi:hypothetical protein